MVALDTITGFWTTFPSYSPGFVCIATLGLYYLFKNAIGIDIKNNKHTLQFFCY